MRTSTPCPKCGGPLRPVAYRKILSEDPHQNYKPIPGTYYCPKDNKFIKTKSEVIKVGR